jgi:hypothetical protein
VKPLRSGAFLLLTAVVSCAIPAPPPGGPEDKTAPEVVETLPADSSAGIPADSDIRITFSEKMTRRGLERQVKFYPNVIIKKTKWDDKTVIIEPDAPLHPDTTYVVKLKPGFQDHHRVSNPKSYEFAFATSAHIDSGRIAGTVYFRRKPTEKGYVHLFALPTDSSFAPEVSRPDRESVTDESGRYELPFLPTSDVEFLLFAFEDQSGNDRFERQKEVGQLYPDTLRLTPDMPFLDGMDIMIVDPNEPGEVSGVVNNLTALDTLPVSVALFAENDTIPPAYYTRCDTLGAYAFTTVRAGVYALRAFVDLLADSLCGAYPCPQDSSMECTEPCAQYPDSVRVEPGIKLELEDLELE